MTHEETLQNRISVKGSMTVVWLATFVFSISTFRLLNDHFDRISRGRQIAAYGELPFRDFFDPGYFMTVFSSAAVWHLLGDKLLGEMLLSASFMATGAALVLLLARRASGSRMIAWVAVLLAVLSMPRAYDYDKFLFYPLGILLCWRYVDLSTFGRLAAFGAGTVAAGLFRYDHGVIILCSGVAAIVFVHAGEWRRLARQAGLLVLATALMALPFLLFIHYQAGIGNSIDQVVTYAGRESSRFLPETPAFSFKELVTLEVMAPPRHVIGVRWAPLVDEAGRTDVTVRYSLRDALPDETDGRTWSFVIDDISTENLRALVADARIEDTSRLDRQRFLVPPEPLWTRVQRAVPLLRVRLHLSPQNAQAFLYYLLVVLPVIAAVMAARMPRSTVSVRQERARVLTLVTMCLLLDVFILRPVELRGGGMAGPVAVLAAWIAGRLRTAPAFGVAAAPGPCGLRRDWWLRAAAALVLALTVWSESVTSDWEGRVQQPFTQWAQTLDRVRAMSASPPNTSVAPGRLTELALYVRTCTKPEDRVFTSWFVPELYYFAQRGFAGGMAVTFSSHWSETRFQRRIIDRLVSQSVPLVILDLGGRSNFVDEYALLWEHLTVHYRVAGETDFGNPDSSGYQVLVPRDRPPVRTYPKWSLPCFA